jgi:hypothetical protein
MWIRESLPVRRAILDGRWCALDSERRQNFRHLLAGRGNLHYVTFNALWVNGGICGSCRYLGASLP